VVAFLMMLGGFVVMARSVLGMFRCLGVVVRCFFRHREFLSSCRSLRGTGGLSGPMNARWVTASRIRGEFRIAHIFRTGVDFY
jgi:hypothetical protein